MYTWLKAKRKQEEKKKRGKIKINEDKNQEKKV